MDRKESIKLGVYGLLIGDAMGVPYEFSVPSEIPPWEFIDFEPPHKFNKAYPCVPSGTWSDDGAQALCLLDSLLSCGKLDVGDLGQRLLAWITRGIWAVDQDVFDCGIQTKRSLKALLSGVSPDKSGFVVPDGKGNGSLMRVLPLALWHTGTNEQLIEDAHKQSIITHGHICNQVCCALYCLWARYIIQEQTPIQAFQSAADFLCDYYREKKEYLHELEICLQDEEPKGTGYVVDSIRTSFYLLSNYKCYPGVIKGAISFGNDTDTTAAIAGGLAALAFKNIPEIWIKHLRSRKLVDELIERV